jgi:hypothetical protein
MSRLQQLHDAGVSIWLDTLSRELIDRITSKTEGSVVATERPDAVR